MLKDEHQALQLAFTALEDKYQKAQDDNRELIERWMVQKAKDADIMNEENAVFMRWAGVFFIMLQPWLLLLPLLLWVLLMLVLMQLLLLLLPISLIVEMKTIMMMVKTAHAFSSSWAVL